VKVVARACNVEGGESDEPDRGGPEPPACGEIEQRDGEVGVADEAEDLRIAIGEPADGAIAVVVAIDGCERYKDRETEEA
jgi:hypothetical protein